MNQTLIIDNVDFEMLEKQRKILGNFLYSKRKLMKEEEKDELLGLCNMLDDWSDKIYYDEQEI